MQAHELTEALAAAAVVLGGLVLVPASIWSYRRSATQAGAERPATTEHATATLTRSAVVVAAALSFGAAVVHGAAIGLHLAEFPPYAYAFGLLAVVQLVLGVGLLRGWPLVRSISIMLSVAVIGVWVVSRTAGLPIAPEQWKPEDIGPADVISSLFEGALVLLLVVGRTSRRWPSPMATRLAASIYVALVPIAGLIAVITLIAVAALMPDVGAHMHS